MKQKLNKMIEQTKNELTVVRNRARTTVPGSVDAAEIAYLEARLDYRANVLNNIRR